MQFQALTFVIALCASLVAAEDGGLEIASLAAQLTVPTTLNPSQTTALARAWASELANWVTGSEYMSVISVLSTAVPETQTTIVAGTETWLTALPSDVQQAIQKEQSALLSIESSVLSGGGAARETGVLVAGAFAAVGAVGAMAIL